MVTIMPHASHEETKGERIKMECLGERFLTMENQKFEIQGHQLPRLLNIYSL